jgi:hypothetical protein
MCHLDPHVYPCLTVLSPRTGVHRVRKKRGSGVDRSESGSTPTNAGQGVSDSYMGHYQYMPYMHPGDPSTAGGYAYGCACVTVPWIIHTLTYFHMEH